MALFAKKQKKSIPGKEVNTEDEILGYLDDIIRHRGTLSIRTKADLVKSSIYDIDDKAKLVRIPGDLSLDDSTGKMVECGFSLDSTWYVFTTKLLMEGGKHYLELPQQIRRKERRKGTRARFTPREKVKVAAIQGLGSGIGVTGFATDVSTGGICLAIERAMIMQHEREVQPSLKLIEKGAQLAIVRINRVPGLPSIEVSGVLNRIFLEGKWKLAIQLANLPGKIKNLLAHFTEERAPKFRPVYRSRKKRLEIEASRKREEEERAAQAAQVTETPETAETAETTETPETIEPSQPLEKEITFVKAAARQEPEPEPVEPFPPAAEEPITGQSLVSLGETLDQHLPFLETDSDYTWIHVDNPVKIVKSLNEKHPRYLLLPWTFNNQSMLDYLQRISGLGVLEGVEVILFSEREIPGAEIVKSRMLGIKHILKLPLESPEELLEILEKG